MAVRNLHPLPIALPFSKQELDTQPLLSQGYFRVPGQNAAIRFFDPYDQTDFIAMNQIMNGKYTRKWMDDVSNIDKEDYEEWAGTFNNESFLFSVHDARLQDPEEFKMVRGFVYLYCDEDDKFRLHRMAKRNLIEPREEGQHALEISFATRPFDGGSQWGSGLISSAARAACLQVYSLLSLASPDDLLIFAFVDKQNMPSHRTLEAVGFVQKGIMRYDPDSNEDNYVYILDWQRLERKLLDRIPPPLSGSGV